jgi:hypothetical protein
VKHLLLSLLIILSASRVYGKDRDKAYTPQKLTVGYFADSSKPLQGLRYELPYGIYQFAGDSSDNVILVLRKIRRNHFGGKGSLLSLNTRTGFINWHKELRRFQIRFTKDFILYKAEESTKVMNRYTGAFLYGTPYYFQFIDYYNNKGLTYGGTYFDFANNKVLWKHKLGLENGWSEIDRIADSTLLIVGNGLHLIHLRNGEGWDYKLTTTKEDYSTAIAVGAAGIVLGALTGVAVIPTGPDYISGLSSNVAIDTVTRDLYYSSLKSTVALDSGGAEIWNKEMDKKETSKSIMWPEDDKLVHINLGYAYLNGVASRQGVPFIAAYEKASGATVFKKELEKGGYVNSIQNMNENTLLGTSSALLLFNHKTGQQMAERRLDKTAKKNPLQVISGKHYFLKGADSSFYSLHELYPQNFIAEDTSTAYELNNNLQTEKQWDLKEVWTDELAFKNILFLRNKDRIAIVKDHQPLAYLSAMGQLVIANNNLLVCDGEQLTVLRLSELIRGEQ